MFLHCAHLRGCGPARLVQPLCQVVQLHGQTALLLLGLGPEVGFLNILRLFHTTFEPNINPIALLEP